MLSNSSHASPSSSSPPSSPPPSSISAVFPLGLTQSSSSSQIYPNQPLKPPKTPIDPRLALDLRLRWLEALLVGVGVGLGVESAPRTGRKSTEKAPGHTFSLCRAAEDLQRRLDAVVASNEGLRRFLAQYDQHAHFLNPAFALSDPTYEEEHTMSVVQLEAFLAEMEPDIRAAERDMSEIEMLESKGVTGVGQLGSYEELQNRLDKLMAQHRADAELAASLEKRIANLMERNATQVDALSELFVAWDDTITDVEDNITRLEKERRERRRLGLEQ
ncbi:hypothetical protein J132_06506 [Termitomyces sp. J132]|nr:hypothetical protein C0989_005525 [Termitomyces sp. Mn162]KNZ74552.1 hypothetical protein J132_06506 [Termitomyces sp. J132]